MDPQLRVEGASGGCITQLLSFALDRGDIDGALLVQPSDTNPVEPVLYLGQTAQELPGSQKSIYTNVPYCRVLRDIRGLDGRYAIVGLPCHIHGILKAIQLDGGLKRGIAFLFGLFCGGTCRVHAIEYYLGTKGIDLGSVCRIDYRWGGWPGKISVILKDGQQVILPRRFNTPKEATSYAAAFNAFFYLERCYSCPDKINELADISFGDPWLEEYKDETQGLSIIVSRSRQAERLLQASMDVGCLELYPTSPDKVMVSQRLLHSRRQSIWWYVVFLRLFGGPYPKYRSAAFCRGSISAFGIALLEHIRRKLGRSAVPISLLLRYLNLERHFRYVFLEGHIRKLFRRVGLFLCL